MADETNPSQEFTNFGENPELLRLLFDVNPTLVFVKDRQGRFVFANKALADVYGTTIENLIGKTDADFNPDIGEIEHFLSDDLRVMNNREELLIPEERVTDPSGSSVWLQTIKRPVIDANDECNHVLGVCVDITARKDSETRERELHERLARSERMESLGVMAGGIAHDLNNILGPLVAYPELLARKVGDDPEIEELLSEMNQATSRATAVIQDMLTLARRGLYDFKPMRINNVVDEYLGSAGFRQLQAIHPEVTIETRLFRKVPAALGSSPHYYQVVMNLVTNAFEASSPEGLIVVSTGVESITGGYTAFSEIPEGDYVYLDVADQGEGILPERMNSIFEPFFSSKPLGRSGSGLGLSVVFGVVQDMNGHIDVQSKPGTGARFRVRLPVLADGQYVEDSPEEIDITGTGTILIIDDLLSQRRLAVRILEALGYEVLPAENCEQALEIIADVESLDCVLIDMVMPEHPDGLDTFRAIRKLRPKLPCIIVSGYAENERIRTARSEGAVGFVKKPYTQRAVGRTIKRAIAN